MAKKLKYKFGDGVNVKGIVKFTYDCSYGSGSFPSSTPTKIERILVKELANCCGIVVGGRYRKIGTVINGVGYYGDDYDPSYLDNVKTVFVYEIKIGFLNRTIEALEEDLSLGMWPSPYNIPLFVSNHPEWDEQSRASLREDMKFAKRDSRGRWLKAGYVAPEGN